MEYCKTRGWLAGRVGLGGRQVILGVTWVYAIHASSLSLYNAVEADLTGIM